jgi:hypothetical protein
VKKNVEALKHGGFADVRTFELLCRDYQVKENATRPGTSMVGHTGFMTFGRKVEREAKVEPNQEESQEKLEENFEDIASNESE